MATAVYIARRLLAGVLLLLGVTLLSFILMVYAAPEQTWTLLGKNPTAEQIAEIRHQLGYDQAFISRYFLYLESLATLDLGYSASTGKSVADVLADTVPVSLALLLPGFVLGNMLALLLGGVAAWRQGSRLDRFISGFAVIGMSISFVVIVIAFQLIFSSRLGLNWFPVRGWEADTLLEYLSYVTVPTLCLVFVSLGYNTRFYRAVLVEQTNKDYVRTARAFGAPPRVVLFRHVLKNSAMPILTRMLFSIPSLIVGGSLLLESYFSIPGIGLVTYNAIVNGDQPILKAVVGLTGVLFVLVGLLADLSYRWLDPRVVLR